MERAFWQPELETLPRKELERLQGQRLKRQIERVGDSPFYQRLWRGAVKPSAVKIARDIQRLPFLHRQDLLEAQMQDPPLGDLPLGPQQDQREVYPLNAAGGTLYTVYAQEDLDRTADIGARILWATGLRPGDVIHNGFSYGLFAGGIFIHRAARTMGAAIVPIGTDGVKRQVEMMFNFKPAMLVGAPSHAVYLAERIQERGLSPRDVGLKCGLFGAEPVIPVRGRLEQLWGAPAYDLYGMTEVGTLLAGECSHQEGMHWAEDHVLVEVIHPDRLEPCHPGEQGVLVLTDLTRASMPLLRYWTGDMATVVTERCSCGRTHARSVGGIRGRTDELVMYRGAKFYPAQVERILAAYGNLGEEYKLILEHDRGAWGDRATLVVEAAPGGAYVGRGLEERLQHHLADELGADMAVQVVPFGSLERSPSKRRRVDDRRERA